MTMFPAASLSSAHSNEKISSADLAYFQDRLRSRLYDLILGEFENAKENGLTQAMLARRLGKRPEQINRWLSTPGNWTVETVSNLLIGISGTELTMKLESIIKDNSILIEGTKSNIVSPQNRMANQFFVQEAALAQVSYHQSLTAAIYTSYETQPNKVEV